MAEMQVESNNFESINDISLENNHRLLKRSIEKIAILKMEFWSQMSEERPGFYFFLMQNYIEINLRFD